MIKHRLLMVKLVLGLLLVPLLSLPAQAQNKNMTKDELIAQLQKTKKTASTSAADKALLDKLTWDQSLTIVKNMTPDQLVLAQIDKMTPAQIQALTATQANTIIEKLDQTRAQALLNNLTGTGGGAGGIAAPGTIEPGNDLWPTVNKLINLVRSYLIPIAILIIIYAGILYETSAMNPALQGTAKTILWTTISGLIFLILYPTLVGILSDNGLIPTTEIDSSSGGVVTPPTPTP